MPMNTSAARGLALMLLLGCGVTLVARQAAPPQPAPPPPALDQKTRDAMPARARQQIDAAPVRVLVPIDPQVLQRAEVTTGNGFYSISARTDDVTVVVQGSPITPTTSRLDVVPPAGRSVGNRRVYTTVNEGIRTASWVENGVAYAIDVECSKAGDARCASDEWMIGLIAKLAYVGGGKQ